MKIIQNLIILCILCLGYALSGAQVFASTFINVQPQNPAPGDTVTLVVDSYLINVETSLVRWFRDETLVLEGIGKDRYIINTISQKENIRVDVVNTQTQERVSQNIIINPASVDLLWESTGVYVPPFYKGKASVNIEGGVRFTAIPDVQNRSNTFFAWSKDSVDVPNASGVNQNSFSFNLSTLDSSNVVGVSVFSTAEEYSATASVGVAFEQPKVLFYEQDQNLGVLFNRALPQNWFVSRNSEYIITAVPYFFASTSLENENVGVVWRSGNQVIPPFGFKNTVRIQTPNTSGRVNLLADFTHLVKRYQNGSVGINLQF